MITLRQVNRKKKVHQHGKSHYKILVTKVDRISIFFYPYYKYGIVRTVQIMRAIRYYVT